MVCLVCSLLAPACGAAGLRKNRPRSICFDRSAGTCSSAGRATENTLFDHESRCLCATSAPCRSGSRPLLLLGMRGSKTFRVGKALRHFDRIRGDFDQRAPNLGEVGLDSSKFGATSTKVGPIWAQLAWIRPDLGRVRAKWADLGAVGLASAEFRVEIEQSGPDAGQILYGIV